MSFEPHDIYPHARSDRIETERLLMRRIVQEDRDSLIPTVKDPAWAQRFGYNNAPDLQTFIDGWVKSWDFPAMQTAWTFTIIEKVGQNTAGYMRIAVRPRNGDGWQAMPEVAMAPQFRGNGYAYEIIRETNAWVFDDLECPPGVKLDEMRLECLQSNAASVALLRKFSAIGMRDLGEHEGIIRIGKHETRPIRVHIFSLVREDYRQNSDTGRSA
jgi:RimJ/RimL family protein N-acetyltransferase